MTTLTAYNLTDADAEIVHGVLSSQLAATKNWVLSAVESGDIEKARKLTSEARKLRDLYATFNVSVHREIEAARKGR